MKNLLYLLLAGSLFIACNGSKEGSATNESTSTEQNGDKSAQNAPPAAENGQSSTTPGESNPGMSAAPASPNDPAPGKATFSFETMKHDFGLLTSDTPVEYTFKFKNTGTEPLIISEARGSCGCTVPDYPKEAIGVGQESEVRVSFHPNKGQSGITPKTVRIVANTNPAVTTLEIVSDVQIPK